MERRILIPVCLLIFSAAYPKANDAADNFQEKRQQALGSPQRDKSPAIVHSRGQNITYSTKGKLETVGTDTTYDIILPSDVLFDFNKSEIRPEAKDLLQKLKQHFATHKTSQVHVFGHTDSKGSDQYNATLSQRRAIAIQKWLKENTGVYAMALGMGEREPLVPNENPDGSDNPENRQRNRRVTVRVVAYPDVQKMLRKYKQQ